MADTVYNIAKPQAYKTKGASKALQFIRKSAIDVNQTNSNSAVWDYAISGTTMYVAADTDGIWVIDISDPENPTQTGTAIRFKDENGVQSSMPVTDVLVIGSTLFACGRAVDWDISNETGMVASYDISTPSTPSYLDTYRPADMSPKPVAFGTSYGNDWYQGMATDGTYLFLASQFNGLTVLDVSTPNAMVLHGAYDEADLETADLGVGMKWETSRICYNANWVYLANHGNGILALDVTNRAAPTNPQWYDAPLVDPYGDGSVQLRIRDVVTDGTYIYCCNNIGGNVDRAERGLLVMDITSPTAVDVNDWKHAPIGFTDNDTWIRAGDQPILGLDIHNSYIYLANGQTGTAVFDITNPNTPTYYGLFGDNTPDSTNNYKTFLFDSGGETFAVYGDAKEGAAQKQNIYFDKVINP